MSDFTKEELKIIRNLINNLDEKMLTWSESVILVQSKIQSMIDNYCEHKQSGEVRDVDFIKVCTQCKEVAGWQ